MKKLLSIIAIVVLTLPVHAQNYADSIVGQARKVKTLKADFVQSKQLSSFAQAAISHGKLFFSTPNKMRWQQDKPSSFLMVFVDAKASIKVGESPVKEFNASSNRMLSELNSIIIGGITGALFENQKDYNVAFDVVEKGVVSSTLLPRNKHLKKYISSIEITFNSSWMASQIVLTEANGNQTVINLSAIKINIPISDSQFVLR